MWPGNDVIMGPLYRHLPSHDGREDDGRGPIIISSLGPPNTLIRPCRCPMVYPGIRVKVMVSE